MKTVSVVSNYDGIYEPEVVLKELYILGMLAILYLVRLEGYTLSKTTAVKYIHSMDVPLQWEPDILSAKWKHPRDWWSV